MDGQLRIDLMPPGVRRARRPDILDMIGLARRSYATWPVDWGSVSAWLSANIERPEVFGAVTKGAASIAMAHEWFWNPKGPPEITMLFLAGDGQGWGVVRCLRATAAWGESLGSHTFKVDAETRIDLAPLLRRIGKPFDRVPAFTMRLRS